MATGPLRPCGGRCGALVATPGRCEACQRALDAARATTRKTARQRGYDEAWNVARTHYLQRNPLCVVCAKQGHTVGASVVDHIKPHGGNHQLFWDRDNWQSLCATCHSRKTAVSDARFGTGAELPQLPRPVNTQLFVICGPGIEDCYQHACALAQPVEQCAVIEAEHLANPGNPYEPSESSIKLGKVKRNQLLSDACEREMWRRAYLVVGAPRIHEREHWKRIAVKLIVRKPALEVCLQSIANDSCAGKDWRTQFAMKWFSNYTATVKELMHEGGMGSNL